MVETYVVGVDPGKLGGYALLDGSGKIVVMRAFDKLTNADIAHDLRALASKFPITAVKEEFASYGVDGRVSFVVGTQHGWIDATLKNLNVRTITVRASEWHKALHQKEPGMKPKFLSLKAANELFAGEKFLRTAKSKKPHMGILEAALIAEYGRRLLEKEMNPCSPKKESAEMDRAV